VLKISPIVLCISQYWAVVEIYSATNIFFCRIQGTLIDTLQHVTHMVQKVKLR
jgi:hypothetical protein